MIAVDTSVIAALVLPTSDSTIAATMLLSSDRDWVAPLLWRSELTNILATGTRNEWFTLDQALEALSTAEELMDGGEYQVPAPDVLRLASETGCTGYDCEFVVLARDLDIKLVTLDRQILKSFPGTAIALSEFRSRSAP